MCNNGFKIWMLISLLWFSVQAEAQQMKFVKPNDAAISFGGTFFIDKSDELVRLNRFDKKTEKAKETFMNPLQMHTQSGVRINFATNSSKIILHFVQRTDAKVRAGFMAVYKDGTFYEYIKLLKKDSLTPMTIENQDGAEWADWQIVLPAYYGMDFGGIEIEKGAGLKKVRAEKKKVYVAIGNSITHGTGQKASDQTYPWLLAQKNNWDLYNLGVGGSKISWPVAKMLEDKHIDVITVLWGYNDWNAGYTLEQITERYTKLLDLLLTHHPLATIYCILPTTTKRDAPKKGTLSIDQIRAAEKAIVEEFQQKGFKNLHLIRGYEISSQDDLRDVVHFNIEGAARFADKLNEQIHQQTK